MKLYGFPFSPNTWKVRALDAHLGLPLDFALVDLAKGEQRTPEYLALNPTGRAPVLVDGDFKLWESAAILQYIAGKTPNALWPDDARARADIMRWQSWQLAHFGKEACEPLLFERFIKKVFNIGPPDAARVAAATEAFHREARVLDAHLAGQPYLVGTALTLADFSVAAALIYAKEGEFPLAPYPHIPAWFDRVFALPAWRETAPPSMPAAA
jgi:glutathione S-transferase